MDIKKGFASITFAEVATRAAVAAIIGAAFVLFADVSVGSASLFMGTAFALACGSLAGGRALKH